MTLTGAGRIGKNDEVSGVLREK